MKRTTGMVLIMVLIFLLVMSLLLSAMLLVSQLSHKAAYAGQQQLQTEQTALAEHMQAVALADAGDQPSMTSLAQCPAQFAAWSASALNCQIARIDTETYSDSRLFYASYRSIVLTANLADGTSDDEQ